MHPETRKWKKQQEEQMRQVNEAQKQQVAQQHEQEKSKAVQMAPVSLPKQEEPPAVKVQVSATPIEFGRLSPAEKAALHWAAAQEYWRVHNTKVNYKVAEALAEIHGITAEAILHKVWANPGEESKVIHALPHRSKSFEKWRAETIKNYQSFNGLIQAVATFEQTQKDEQLKSPRTLNGHGCEWMTGKYYIDSDPTSLCPPVIDACVGSNCNNRQEQQKTESMAQMNDTEQENSGEKKEPDDLPSQDPYGSNDATTSIEFLSLSPAEKAALHWTAAEFLRLSSAEKAALHWAAAQEYRKALPFQPKNYEKWRAETIEKHNTKNGLSSAIAALDRKQKEEQLNTSLNRRGCAWMTGKYYIDSNPTSLCTPVLGKCVEGNCDNGHGTYVSFDGSKFVGEFRRGDAFLKDSIYGYGKCVKGNCTDGHGTYVFRDRTKYVGDFKNAKPHGQGTKTWAIGFSYTGEFIEGIDTGKGNYTPLVKRNLSQESCLEGDCYNGQGVMIYENDTKYVGHFKRGEPNGQGIYYWRTGEALEGEFDNGELKLGGNHISPDGSITVQNKIARGWHKTYAEEKVAAKRQETAIDLNNLLLDKRTREIILREGLKIMTCHGYHREGSLAWNYCGQ